MGQIYGAEPYLCHLWGRAPPQCHLWGRAIPVPSLVLIYGADLWGSPSQCPPPVPIYGAALWGPMGWAEVPPPAPPPHNSCGAAQVEEPQIAAKNPWGGNWGGGGMEGDTYGAFRPHTSAPAP